MKVKKQKRQAAVLTAVQLGAVLAPLTQVAQADALDDAVTSAKAKGFDASVSDQPAEKVASKKVAEAKTAESKAQVEKDAQALTKAVADFEAQDAQVKRENEEHTKAHEDAVKAENARVQTAEEANKAIEAENAKAQQAYEAEKAKVEADNAATQKAYEAEKAKVEADNAAAQKAYETEKAKVEADNKAKLAQYETALKQVQAENQKLQADYEVAVKKATDAKATNDAELKRVDAENAKNKAQYEADLKRITAERDALTKQYEADKARIEKENSDNKAAVDTANAKIEADYQKAKADYDAEVARIQKAGSTSQAAYEAEVARITKENEAIDAENAKAKADYEAKKAAVQKANADAEKAYQEALKAYQAGKTSGETVKTKTIEDTTLAQKAKDAGVPLKPEHVVEKDLTASTDLKADMANVEAEAKTAMDKVKEQLEAGRVNPAVPKGLTASDIATAKKGLADQIAATNTSNQKLNVPVTLSLVESDKTVSADEFKNAVEAAKAKIANSTARTTTTTDQNGKTIPWAVAQDPLVNTLLSGAYSADLYRQADAAKNTKNLPIEEVVVDPTTLETWSRVNKPNFTAEDAQAFMQEMVNQTLKVTNANASGLPAEVTSTMSPSTIQATYSKVDEATYKRKVAEWEKTMDLYDQTVDAWNKKIVEHADEALMSDLAEYFGNLERKGGPSYRVKNANKMVFKPSSNKVTYVTTQNYSTVDDAMNQGVDLENPAYHTSATPVEGQIGDVKYYAVRIPKGESMTVSYTRQDGKDYVNPWANFENYSLWVKKSTYDQKDKFTKPDFKGIHQYDLTITNDGSITENGDMMVFFTNDTVQPLYFGVSDMTSTPGKRTFKALPNKAELYGYHQKVQFRDSDGDILMPTIKQIGHANRNVPQQPQTGWNQSVKAKFTSPENAKVREFVGSAKTGTDTHGLNWDSNFKPVESLTGLPSDWKETAHWMSNQVGVDSNGAVSGSTHVYNGETAAYSRHERGNHNVGAASTAWMAVRGTDGHYSQYDPLPTPLRVYSDPTTWKVLKFKPVPVTVTIPKVTALAAPEPVAVTPVKYVIKYKEGYNGTEPKKPTPQAEPAAPQLKEKKPLPTKPGETPSLPKPPVKGQLQVAAPKPLPKEPKLPELPQKPAEVKPNPSDPATEVKKPNLKPEPQKPELSKEPTPPTPKKMPDAPKLKEVPKAPTPKTTTPVEKRDVPPLDLVPEPKKPSFHYERKSYVFEPKTIWETEDGHVLKTWEDGEKPKGDFDGYDFVKTVTDEDGNIHHIYKPVKKVTTIWVTVDGKVLRARKDGTLPKDSFDGYEYVRTDVDKDGNTTHVFKPVEKPTKKVTTIWVTIDGTVLRERKDGTLPKDHFDGYEFVETRVDEDGNTTHIFKPVVKSIKTIWETVDKTITLREWQDGEQPKDSFDGYEYVTTEIDKDGNIHHLYKPVVKETPKVERKDDKLVYQPQTAKELPKTGDGGLLTTLLGSGFIGGGFFSIKRKKNRKK